MFELIDPDPAPKCHGEIMSLSTLLKPSIIKFCKHNTELHSFDIGKMLHNLIEDPDLLHDDDDNPDLQLIVDLIIMLYNLDNTGNPLLTDDTCIFIYYARVYAALDLFNVNTHTDKWGDGDSKTPCQFVCMRIDNFSTCNKMVDRSNMDNSNTPMILINFNDMIACTITTKASAGKVEELIVIDVFCGHKEHSTLDPMHVQFCVKQHGGSNIMDTINGMRQISYQHRASFERGQDNKIFMLANNCIEWMLSLIHI